MAFRHCRKRIIAARRTQNVRLVLQLTVYEYFPVLYLNRIARYRDYTFDKIAARVARILKYQDITAFRGVNIVNEFIDLINKSNS